MNKNEATGRYWSAYCKATAWHGSEYDVIRFGDSDSMAEELLALVLNGTKRATASLLRDYSEANLPVPQPGDHVMVLDARNEPCCIYRSSDVRIGPLISVDERFAWDEGEGDRTRNWWLDAHRGFFSRQAAKEGFPMHDGIETVFERFRVVWPREWADSAEDQSSR